MPIYTVSQHAAISMKIEAATPEEAAWIYEHHSNVVLTAENKPTGEKPADPRITDVNATWECNAWLFGGDLAPEDTREI